MNSSPQKTLDDRATEAQDKFHDRKALDRFIAEIYPTVRAICQRIARKTVTAHRPFDFQDLTQTVAVKIWRSLPSFDPERGRFGSWIRVVAWSCWKELLASPPMPSLDDEALSNVPSQACLAERASARVSLTVLRSQLSPEGFDLLMRNAAGSSAEDIAIADAANVNTVKSRLKTVRLRALTYLANDDFEPGNDAVAG